MTTSSFTTAHPTSHHSFYSLTLILPSESYTVSYFTRLDVFFKNLLRKSSVTQSSSYMASREYFKRICKRTRSECGIYASIISEHTSFLSPSTSNWFCFFKGSDRSSAFLTASWMLSCAQMKEKSVVDGAVGARVGIAYSNICIGAWVPVQNSLKVQFCQIHWFSKIP